jgi:phospholipid/cholesterol/gamma-HCH transport system substrate-binding protein
MPGEQPQTALPRSGHRVTILIVVVGLFALGGMLFLKISSGPSLRLRTCFQDANGLRRDAKVRSAGVDIGRVRAVRAQPSDKACLAAVEMEIRTPYELKIPKDSVASTATAGVLGETYLEIDASAASGPPILADGQLPSKERTDLTVAAMERALKAVDELSKRLADALKNCSAPAAKSQTAAKAQKP